MTIYLFFFNDTATTEIYTLSLHDALPISTPAAGRCRSVPPGSAWRRPGTAPPTGRDRKSTRLNSSHQIISYAVFCLKKKDLERGGLSRIEAITLALTLRATPQLPSHPVDV